MRGFKKAVFRKPGLRAGRTQADTAATAEVGQPAAPRAHAEGASAIPPKRDSAPGVGGFTGETAEGVFFFPRLGGGAHGTPQPSLFEIGPQGAPGFVGEAVLTPLGAKKIEKYLLQRPEV